MGGVAKGRVVPIRAQDHDDRSRLRAVFEVFGEPSDHRPDEASSKAAQGKVIVARAHFQAMGSQACTPLHLPMPWCVSPPAGEGPTISGITGTQGPTRWRGDATPRCRLPTAGLPADGGNSGIDLLLPGEADGGLSAIGWHLDVGRCQSRRRPPSRTINQSSRGRNSEHLWPGTWSPVMLVKMGPEGTGGDSGVSGYTSGGMALGDYCLQTVTTKLGASFPVATSARCRATRRAREPVSPRGPSPGCFSGSSNKSRITVTCSRSAYLTSTPRI